MLASLPMYNIQPAAVQAWWEQLAQRLAAAGVAAPAELTWPKDIHRHWHDPKLLISQACGFPLVTELAGQVQVLGTFTYAVQGAQGHLCRSLLIARAADQGKTLADFKGRVLAHNSADSQSGYNSLRARVAPLADQGAFFSASKSSGGHLASIDMVRCGAADLASVDCVSWAGIQRYSPESTQGLVVVGQTEAYPGLPLITSLQTPAATVAVMRQVLAQAVQDPALQALHQALFIKNFVVLEPAHYQVCLDMRDQALALGCTSL